MRSRSAKQNYTTKTSTSTTCYSVYIGLALPDRHTHTTRLPHTHTHTNNKGRALAKGMKMKKLRRTCWHRLEVAVSSKSIIVSTRQCKERERDRKREQLSSPKRLETQASIAYFRGEPSTSTQHEHESQGTTGGYFT